MRLFILTVLLCFFAHSAWAHGSDHGDSPSAQLFRAAQQRPQVNIRTSGNFRYIRSNGIPRHNTGDFPNRSNPHAIRAQQHNFRLPRRPLKTDIASLTNRMFFGVALNGVPFDPGTAEYYNNNPRSGWRIEALTGGANLGLDRNNAHVQPGGAYHYHGIPWGLISRYAHDRAVTGDLMLAGYAADGFPVYMPVEKGQGRRSSYRLKQGTRPSGPGGEYDGTYTQDWEYVPGRGDLDRCNGAIIKGRYAYVLTEQFPFIPRCFMGTPDRSFIKRAAAETPPPSMQPPRQGGPKGAPLSAPSGDPRQAPSMRPGQREPGIY